MADKMRLRRGYKVRLTSGAEYTILGFLRHRNQSCFYYTTGGAFEYSFLIKEVIDKNCRKNLKVAGVDPDKPFELTPIERPKEPERAAFDDNFVQFPRLLAEIRARGIQSEDFDSICESMDLPPAKVDELLERAEAEWEHLKAGGTPRRYTPAADIKRLRKEERHAEQG
jgi:hypothetical protein